ncbi:MAG: hypothetical protein IK990_09245 [Ruminiclostridium sp.]|nr:hypothetical protein [Ruminiclostridium sp.]
MAKQGSDFYENFTKNVYETIKELSNDERGDFVIHTYENLYGKLKTESSSVGSSVDLARLREDLSHIRGIGGQRLDEIMAVIQRHLMPDSEPQPAIARADGITDDDSGPDGGGEN